MTAAAIGAALKARLSSLTFSEETPVAWPNRDFAPSTDRWMTAQIVHAPNQRLTIGNRNRRAGSFVVTVASRTNAGSGEGDGIADAVAAHFPADLAITAGTGTIRVTETPSVRQGFQDGGYWRTPVTIPFEVLE
jgi:hypothetical protein